MTRTHQDMSVILCTRNPKPEYFRQCLRALEAQTFPQARWEIIVVDNASEPRLEVDLSWHAKGRVVREETLGLTSARLRGIRESTGDLLVFVDDDNVLDPDYLETARRIALERSHLGAWSGQCRPEFEQVPPPWTRPYWGNLVIREFQEDVWSNLPLLAASMPCGAGLCVRREVGTRYVLLHDRGRRGVLLDRRGESLVSGGDNDLAGCACDVGLGVGLIASLKLTHLIPPARLTIEYLSSLVEGIYFSTVILAHYRAREQDVDAYAVRWTERVRALLARGPQRRIYAAAFRGRQRGLKCVASLRQQPSPSPP